MFMLSFILFERSLALIAITTSIFNGAYKYKKQLDIMIKLP